MWGVKQATPGGMARGRSHSPLRCRRGAQYTWPAVDFDGLFIAEELYVIGHDWYDVCNEPDALRSSILIVNKANLVTYHFTDPLKVFAVKVDFDLHKIYPPTPFQRLLKFGNWEEPTDDQKMMYLQLLDSKFSDKDIIEKIILPLAPAHLE